MFCGVHKQTAVLEVLNFQTVRNVDLSRLVTQRIRLTLMLGVHLGLSDSLLGKLVITGSPKSHCTF